MITESYALTYPCEVLEDMSDEKRQVFVGPLRKYVISQGENKIERKIIFYFYKDHFLEVVARWPWLLCSDLGAHFDVETRKKEQLARDFAKFKQHKVWP